MGMVNEPSIFRFEIKQKMHVTRPYPVPRVHKNITKKVEQPDIIVFIWY